MESNLCTKSVVVDLSPTRVIFIFTNVPDFSNPTFSNFYVIWIIWNIKMHNPMHNYWFDIHILKVSDKKVARQLDCLKRLRQFNKVKRRKNCKFLHIVAHTYNFLSKWMLFEYAKYDMIRDFLLPVVLLIS